MSHALEIHIDLPVSKAQADRFCRDPQQFFVRNLKRKTVEVFEKKMSPEERAAFGQAKQAEVKKVSGCQGPGETSRAPLSQTENRL